MLSAHEPLLLVLNSASLLLWCVCTQLITTLDHRLNNHLLFTIENFVQIHLAKELTENRELKLLIYFISFSGTKVFRDFSNTAI